MIASLLDGKSIAASIRKRVAEDVERVTRQRGRAPSLHVVLVGQNEASAVYVRNKEKAAREAGIEGVVHRLEANAPELAIATLIQQLNDDPTVDAILVQLPLPAGVNEHALLDLVLPAKDVDGFHPVNAGLLASGREGGLVPCTPLGCLELIDEALKTLGQTLDGAHAVVVGRSNIVGKPVAQLLLRRNATVTIAHSRTPDLRATCASADVLVVAVGRPKLVTDGFVKKGAIVIDVGINRGDDGKLVGDVDFEAVREVAGAITPVPGGVGPMTIAMLLRNTVFAANARTT